MRYRDGSLEACSIIFQVIVKERQYVQDLDFVESVRTSPTQLSVHRPPLILMFRLPSQCFIKGLRRADPPVIPPQELDEFIEEVFGNISELRQCNRRLLDVLSVRQREQQPVIQRIGDVFLNAAADFRSVYPVYVGHLPVAEKRIKEEMESNAEFRRFLEVCCDVHYRFTSTNICDSFACVPTLDDWNSSTSFRDLRNTFRSTHYCSRPFSRKLRRGARMQTSYLKRNLRSGICIRSHS